jgi:hypothetical protein
VLELRPADHPDRPGLLSSLAVALNSQFGQSGQRKDLDEAISLHRASLPQIADPQIIEQAIQKYADQACLKGYDWVKTDWGYQCRGGGHKLTWEQLGMIPKPNLMSTETRVKSSDLGTMESRPEGEDGKVEKEGNGKVNEN